jgi:hypothetical protein
MIRHGLTGTPAGLTSWHPEQPDMCSFSVSLDRRRYFSKVPRRLRLPIIYLVYEELILELTEVAVTTR